MKLVIEFRKSDACVESHPLEPDFLVVKADEFVQLTYCDLRLGPEGDFFAYLGETGDWIVKRKGKRTLHFSDVVIAGEVE